MMDRPCPAETPVAGEGQPWEATSSGPSEAALQLEVNGTGREGRDALLPCGSVLLPPQQAPASFWLYFLNYSYLVHLSRIRKTLQETESKPQ